MMATLRGELLLACTGVTPAIRPGPVRITLEVMGRAEEGAFERAIRRRLRRFFRERTSAPLEPRPPFDYDEIAELLPQMSNEARNIENVSAIRDQALANEYAEALGTAIGYLQRVIPVETAPVLIGGARVRPPDYEVARFRRQMAVLDRPLVVLDDLCSGWLVDDQVETLAEVYPGLHGMIRKMVGGLITDELDRKASWQLPYAKDNQLQVLLQADAPAGGLHAAILKAWEDARATESGQGGDAAAAKIGPTPSQRRGIGDPSTQSERLEAK